MESITRWRKKLHTLACCKECQKHKLQLNFPIKPHFEQEPLVTLNCAELQRLGSKHGTQNVLEEINHSFQQEFKKSFTDSLVQHSGTGIQKKPTSTQRKKNYEKSIESAVTRKISHWWMWHLWQYLQRMSHLKAMAEKGLLSTLKRPQLSEHEPNPTHRSLIM